MLELGFLRSNFSPWFSSTTHLLRAASQKITPPVMGGVILRICLDAPSRVTFVDSPTSSAIVSADHHPVVPIGPVTLMAYQVAAVGVLDSCDGRCHSRGERVDGDRGCRTCGGSASDICASSECNTSKAGSARLLRLGGYGH